MCVIRQFPNDPVTELFLEFSCGKDKSMPEQVNIFRAFLHVATFCEKVLNEADGVISIIRMIDRFNVQGAAEEMQTVMLQFTLFISFKSGFLRGKHKVSIRPKSPKGDDLPSMDIPVLFEGDDDRGPALQIPIGWSVQEEGLFWWELYLNEELVTRMPLRVNYQQVKMPIPGS